MITQMSEMLRVARTARCLTLEEMGRATGVSSSYLSRLETRRIEKPGADILAKIADAYGIPTQTLLNLARYGEFSQHAPVFRTIPAYLFEAATVLTESDWQLLQVTVDRLVAWRRAGVDKPK